MKRAQSAEISVRLLHASKHAVVPTLTRVILGLETNDKVGVLRQKSLSSLCRSSKQLGSWPGASLCQATLTVASLSRLSRLSRLSLQQSISAETKTSLIQIIHGASLGCSRVSEESSDRPVICGLSIR
jgi:hypothetical protein